MKKVRVKISDEQGALVADYEVDMTEDGRFEFRAPDEVREYRVTVEGIEFDDDGFDPTQEGGGGPLIGGAE